MTGTSPRWQEKGLSISFRACQLASMKAVADALDAGETAVSPQAVGHLDLAENELESIELLRPYSRLLSLDVSHNNVEQLVGLPPTLLHLNVAYNRLEGIEGIGSWGGGLLELNLSYNLLTSLQPLEQITQLQVLLAGGNRISSLIGLAGLGRLELCDARFNYVEKTSELRLLSMNTSLRTLSLGGNPATASMQFVPQAVVGGGWQSASPYATSASKRAAASGNLGGRLESRQIEISQIEISADLDESDGADEKKLREQKLALAAAVASKEATMALNRALSRAQRGTPGPNGQTPLPTNGAVAGDAPPAAPPSTAPLSSSRASELQTPVHRAPAAFRSGAVLGGGGGRSAAAPSVSTANASSDMATLGSAQYSATDGHRAQYSAGSARPANAQYSAANAQYVAAPSSAASVRQAAILRQAGGRTDITTDVKGLVRSYSAEALKPGLIRSKSAEAIRHGAIRLTRQFFEW
ncbi:hypothetical protein Ctob_008705 [Chrysochromulina tobinii]|uniref:Uncharacterized protein n=1 Tax=Chrysochromulina tobinii TaxID=1460289 RepID=A0A0M0JNP4_9EUKA|nr:hypothetical protein Ctob_008705 [Chrysochromulina tobinii]|eukprot:KOO27878.1 hypothetical protein Ctob_008705 [Chrysochromulina sp. CCMP291]